MKRIVGAGLTACALVIAAVTGAAAEQPGIRCVQNELNALGFAAGAADGTIGPRTRNAAEAYRKWMADGAGGEDWSQPPLTALNGQLWCTGLAKAHPELASLAGPKPEAEMHLAPGRLVATFTIPSSGRVTAWRLHFAFRTECENDHHADISSPRGLTMGLMDRGLGRCTGSPTTYTSDNRDDPGVFTGTQAKGKWTFTFKDLDANFYSGELTELRMELSIENGGVTTKQMVSLPGLPVQIPNPV